MWLGEVTSPGCGQVDEYVMGLCCFSSYSQPISLSINLLGPSKLLHQLAYLDHFFFNPLLFDPYSTLLKSVLCPFKVELHIIYLFCFILSLDSQLRRGCGMAPWPLSTSVQWLATRPTQYLLNL